MSVIYEPKGKAREYSPLAVNIYDGCNHGCKYCYAPMLKRTERNKYITPRARKNIIKLFEKDCKNYYGTKKQVLFTFISDPYNRLEKSLRLTRKCLEIAFEHRIPVAILTKSTDVLNDIDVFKKFGDNIQVGFTFTFDNEKDSRIWEPGASLPEERLEAIRILKKNNIKTWASFEPVIKPEQSLNMMRKGY